MSHSKIQTGVYVCHCGTNIASTVDINIVTAYARELDGVQLARDYAYMCSEPGQELIKQDIRQYGLNRIVVAACSPLMHEPTFRRACTEAGLNPFLMLIANIREHCSWVVDDKEQATQKAKAAVAAAIWRVRSQRPLNMRKVQITPAALILGGGIAGIEAALRLADSGKRVYLVEREPSIGGRLSQIYKTFPTLDCAA
jgi:heterodisulfide reductase subunit A2